MMHFIFASTILLKTFIGLPALANAMPDHSCDGILSLYDPSSSAALSPGVRSYLGAIQFYSQKTGGGLDQVFVERILNSKDIINPFAGKIDTLSIALSNAIEKILSKIKSSEWSIIQQAVRELGQKHSVQQADRDEKADETSWLKEVKHLGTKQFSQSGIDRTDAYIELVGGRLLSVQWSDGHIFVHEFDEKSGWNKITHLNKISGWKDAVFSWQVVGDKIYLAYLPGNLAHAKIYDDSERTKKYLSIFELTANNGLVFKSRAETVFSNDERPVWFISEEKIYVLAGGHVIDWQLFQFENEKLSYVSNLKIVQDNAFTPLVWLEKAKRRLLAVLEDDNIVVKEIRSRQLVEVAKIVNKNEISNLHLQQVGERIFLSAIQKQEGFKGGTSFLYEIEKDKIDLIAQLDFAKRVGRQMPAVYIENGSIFTIHDSDLALYHHQITPDKTVREVEVISVPRNLTSPVGFFEIGLRKFVYFGTFADKQYLYEIMNGTFVFLHETVGARHEQAIAPFVVKDNFHLAFPFREKAHVESYQYQKQIKRKE